METQAPPTDDTKTRLIQAAGEEFAGRGFREATVRDICARAGAHVGAVNHHFGDTEGLHEAVLDHSHRMATQKYPPDMGLDSNAGPEERLSAFVRSLLLRILGDGLPAWHGKLMAQEIANPTGPMKQIMSPGFPSAAFGHWQNRKNKKDPMAINTHRKDAKDAKRYVCLTTRRPLFYA